MTVMRYLKTVFVCSLYMGVYLESRVTSYTEKKKGKVGTQGILVEPLGKVHLI